MAYTKLLLAKGADPNLPNQYGESALHLALGLYIDALKKADKPAEEHYFQVILLLIEKGADVFCKSPHGKNNYIEMVFNNNFPRLQTALKSYYKDNPTVQAYSISPEEQSANAAPTSNFTSLTDVIVAIRNMENDLVGQDLFFDLQKQYQSASESKIILYNLILLYQRGSLTSENIIKLIALLDKNKNFKKYIPFLYREYLSSTIIAFEFSLEAREKELALLKLFACFQKWVTYLPHVDEQERECIILEINDQAQRIIQLALSCAQGNGIAGLDRFLYWIDKTDNQYFDDETKLMIWQLRITHAYFALDKDMFDVHYKEIDKYLSANHLLRRQYEHWYKKLVLRKTDEKPPIEKLSMPSYTQDIQVIEKNKKAAYQPSVVTYSSSSSYSNNNNNSSEPDLPPKIKTKTRGIAYPELHDNAIEELAQRVDPNILAPVHSEAEVRKNFSAYLKKGDTLKPVSYKNKFGIFWAVCNFDELNLEKSYDMRFKKEFAKSNIVRPSAPSGLSFKKTFRLMLGNNDPRLHSTLYITDQSTCSLIRFDEFWVHDDKEIEVRTININQVSIGSSSKLKH